MREALARGHEVTAFARSSKRNERIARRFKRTLTSDSERVRWSVIWGDVRKRQDLDSAVQGHDAVIHLAAILPPRSDAHPDLCEAVNVGGTKKLLEALSAEAEGSSTGDDGCAGDHAGHPVLVYVSSVSVMGPTQSKQPPVGTDEPTRPSDAYSASKVAAEKLVRDSLAPWAILRLSAVMPTKGAYRLSMARLMFDMALSARCEIVVDLDVAYALVEAAENLCDGGAISGKTVFIAGGREQGCQMIIEEMLKKNLAAVGLKLPLRRLFRSDLDSYYLDWYETQEGQGLLGYQRHSVTDWERLSCRRFRLLRRVLWPVKGLAWLYLDWVGFRERSTRG